MSLEFDGWLCVPLPSPVELATLLTTATWQKGVMISHHNVIANVLQIRALEKPSRDSRKGNSTEVALGLLPLSHIYGLVVIAQASTYRGDGVIILPKFDLQSYLRAIQTYKIQTLYLVSYDQNPFDLRELKLGSRFPQLSFK